MDNETVKNKIELGAESDAPTQYEAQGVGTPVPMQEQAENRAPAESPAANLQQGAFSVQAAQYAAVPAAAMPQGGQSAQPAPGAPWGAAAYGAYPAPVAQKKVREPFHAGAKDGIFTLVCLLCGILFIYWVLFAGFMGWGVTAMAVLYAAALVGYAKSLKIEIKRETFFWLAVFLLAAGSYTLFGQWEFGGWRNLFLFLLAVYLNGSIFGVLLQNKTGNAFVLDGVNLLFRVPFKNVDITFKGVKALREKYRGAKAGDAGETGEKNDGKKPAKFGRFFGVGLGILLCLMVFPVILPLLLEADGGGFDAAMRGVNDFFAHLFEGDWVFNLVKILLGVAVGLYLFWLAAGSAHRRYTTSIDVKQMGRNALVLKKLPVSSLAIVLVAVCAVYVLFIATQVPYFFSAFTGKLPEGFLNYSEYARKGFFELCGIAAINLSIMLGTAVFLRVHVAESKLVTGLLAVLSALTVLLVATAESKMFLYIDAYGLSPKRILTAVFLLFLACLCVAVIVLLFKWFSLMRFALILGSAMMCALCLVNVDDVSVQYNAARYLDGVQTEFILGPAWGCQAGGFASALRVYEAMPDGEEREDLGVWLLWRRQDADDMRGTTQDTVGDARIRAVELPFDETFGTDGGSAEN